MKQISVVFSICTPLALGAAVSLAQPALAAADLVVTRIESTGSPTLRGDVIEVPLSVTVRNQGTSAAGAFKISTEYSTGSDRRAYAVAFTVPRQTDIWYPRVTSLAAGRDITFNGKVSFRNSLRGQAVVLRAIADSCSGDEFMPSHCRVRESNESNNRSLPITIPLAISSSIFSPVQQDNRYRRDIWVSLLPWADSLASTDW